MGNFCFLPVSQVEVLNGINHKNIVHFFGAIYDPPANFGLVTRKCVHVKMEQLVLFWSPLFQSCVTKGLCLTTSMMRETRFSLLWSCS